jgi:hypothetical protein
MNDQNDWQNRFIIKNTQKDWQWFFNNTSPSKIIVVDRKGQRTADGNTEKYNNTYKFFDSLNRSIRGLFRINFVWTETELGITITKAEIVPVTCNNGNYYGKTAEQVKNTRVLDINPNILKWGANSLCRLSYTSVDDKTRQEKIFPTGIFLPYYGSLEFFPKAGYFLVSSANEERFKNMVKQAFGNQLSK